MLQTTVAQTIQGILAERDIERKLAAAAELTAARRKMSFPRTGDIVATQTAPGRPEHWTILPPMSVPERPDLATERGRFLLMHNVAHIEVSAVELALMAVADFANQEPDYYLDMLRIAEEEVQHARLLLTRLRELGGELGEEPVHLGLWQTAQSYDDILDRLAVVPRILEAKGLDVSAKLRGRLRGSGDETSARILDRVYFDEIGHVRVGTRWYRRICERRGIDSEVHFARIASEFRSNRPIPFDSQGRRKAGFTDREMEAILGRKLSR